MRGAHRRMCHQVGRIKTRQKYAGFCSVCVHGKHGKAKQDAARVKMSSSFKPRTFELFTPAVSCLGKAKTSTLTLVSAYRLEPPSLTHQRFRRVRAFGVQSLYNCRKTGVATKRGEGDANRESPAALEPPISLPRAFTVWALARVIRLSFQHSLTRRSSVQQRQKAAQAFRQESPWRPESLEILLSPRLRGASRRGLPLLFLRTALDSLYRESMGTSGSSYWTA